jgi:hypothetical protein
MKNKDTGVINALRDCMGTWPIATFLCGIGVGVSLMYLLDPKLGSKRRSYINQTVRGAINDLEVVASSKVRDFGNHALGVVAQARSALTPEQGEEQKPERSSEHEMVEGQSAGDQSQAA